MTEPAMGAGRAKASLGDWLEQPVARRERREFMLPVSESYAGATVNIPIQVQRARASGPVVFVTAALHGDEINGTGAIRQLIQDETFRLVRGAVVLVPVLNLLGFDRHSRYLPDRRDLNRSFPGSATGSLANRMAHRIFSEIVLRCDYGIDLHTAAVRRTNYPNVRGDLTIDGIPRLAKAFGSEVIVNSKGPAKSLRREASRAGCKTILVEAGEIWKVEPGVVATMVRGIRNVLKELGMLAGALERPPYQLRVSTTKWIRANHGGFLQFHVSPGDIVAKGDPLATNTNLLGQEQRPIAAPFNAVVIGMTTLPAISPGEPICHLGRLPRGARPAELRRKRARADGLEERVADELSSSVLVVDSDG